MHPRIDQHRLHIDVLCLQYGVRRLDWFGSAADDGEVNLVVEFADRAHRGAADRYFGLLFALEDRLGCHVNLVMESAIRNPMIRREIAQTRASLHVMA